MSRRLLIVDDDIDFAANLERACVRAGYEVRICTDSHAAVATVGDFQPEILLLDIVMPDRDGIELLGSLRHGLAGAQVVLVTGYDPHYAEMGRKLGAPWGIDVAAILTKPVRLATLTETLAGLATAAAPAA